MIPHRKPLIRKKSLKCTSLNATRKGGGAIIPQPGAERGPQRRESGKEPHSGKPARHQAGMLSVERLGRHKFEALWGMSFEVEIERLNREYDSREKADSN